MFGYKLAEVIGRNVLMLMPEPDCSKHDGFLKAHRRKGGNRHACIDRRVMGLRKNGDEFPLRLVVAEVEMNGEKYFCRLTGRSLGS